MHYHQMYTYTFCGIYGSHTHSLNYTQIFITILRSVSEFNLEKTEKGFGRKSFNFNFDNFRARACGESWRNGGCIYSSIMQWCIRVVVEIELFKFNFCSFYAFIAFYDALIFRVFSTLFCSSFLFIINCSTETTL